MACNNLKLLGLPAKSPEFILVLAVFFGETVYLQWLCGAYQNSFGGHPDEAAHFITALMARDFLAGAHFVNPLEFAQQYYAYYPKVAIGHWPPILYGILGTWFFAFGVSREVAMLFLAVVVATLAYIIYLKGKQLLGRHAGLFASGVFIALPLIQEYSSLIMTEHLVTLFMLVSALQFATFMHTERISDGVLFGVISAMAILTRGSAWALAGLPMMAILLTRRFIILRKIGFWVAALPVLILCVPWYVLTQGMINGSWQGQSSSPQFFLEAIVDFSWILFSRLGIPLVVASLIGLWATIILPFNKKEILPEWAVLFSLAICTFILHCIIPASIEARFMVTLMPSLILFAAAGTEYLTRRFQFKMATSRFPRPVLFVAVAGLFLVVTFRIPVRLQNAGYERVVKAITSQFQNVPPIYLIAADSIGEGSLIAEVALAEKRPRSIVLRGSKLLVHEDWLGRGTEDRFASLQATRSALDQTHVSVVIVDDTTPVAERRSYYDRLTAIVREGQWDNLAPFAVMRSGRLYKNGLQVYVRRGSEAPSAMVIEAIKRFQRPEANNLLAHK